MARYVIAAWLLGSLASTAARGDEAPVPPGPPIGTAPTIAISLVDPDDRVHVWGDVRLQATFVAPPQTEGIAVSDICISVPRRLAIEVKSSEAEKSVGACDLVSAFDLRGSGARSVTDPIDFEPRGIEDWRRFLSVVTYHTRTEVVTIRATYVPLGKPELKIPFESSLRIQVDAHPLGMFVGAIVGALLAALLVISLRLSAQDLSPKGVAWSLAIIGGRCVRGTVSAAIVILISKTTSELRMPITIAVHDFYGGVLLGMFGDAIAMSIWGWMQRVEAGESDREAGGAGGPVDGAATLVGSPPATPPEAAAPNPAPS